MSYTQGGEDGRTVTSIPLTDANPPGSASIGSLVRDATEQLSTLVRAEVALAKAEVTGEIRKGLTGSVFFILALVVLLYSSFFFFFFLAELLDTWLWRWLGFLIVFLLMVAATVTFAFLGWLKVRKVRAPEKTIGSLKASADVFPQALGKLEGEYGISDKSGTAPKSLDR
ncbi:phage holin family protein [Nocardia camponoti]|uniref:Membrane protein n=1 Tax=Nocardia camponoti TaxID=1616106 RepID=A0A917VB84_9NOCA|nr:phage holin family protein [Nocardia camponoti]GGK60722.1 membrane protein [Nocardia camponoti]